MKELMLYLIGLAALIGLLALFVFVISPMLGSP